MIPRALLALALGGAATALSWREAKLAKAGAEELSLATILPAAQGLTIPRLATLIRERLSDDAREARSGLQRIDSALQAAYDRGARANELAPLWKERSELLSTLLAVRQQSAAITRI